MKLAPRERRFYQLFSDQAAHLVEAAGLLSRVTSPETLAEPQAQIRAIEHQGDEVTHEIVRLLNRTFVAPFDREDIYALSSGLDDILDYIDEVAITISTYKVRHLPPAFGEMSRLILAATQQLGEALGKLESRKGLEPHWIEIHRLENEGDTIGRNAIAELFSGAVEPLEVVKLKDVYALLEEGLDRCEDVANVIESITIKNA